MSLGATEISIVHPTDPWSPRLGGFDTWIEGFLRYAPQVWQIELIGVSADPARRPIGKWQEHALYGRPIRFLPVIHDSDPAKVRAIPLALRFAMSCRRRRAKAQGKIVQFHRFESILAVPPGLGQRKSCFIHNHPPELLSAYSDVRWKHFRAMFRATMHRSLANADAVWCVDPRSPATLEAELPGLTGRLHWISVWADRSVFHPAAASQTTDERRSLRQRLGRANDTPLIVFAGRFELQKDPLLLIDAFSELSRRRSGVTLLLVGQGRLEQAILDRGADKHVAAQIHIWPPVQRENLASIYRGCDLAVCSSAYESGARHVFEPLACGVPVVSFDVGQTSMALAPLEDLGLLVHERNASSLAAGLERGLGLTQSDDLIGRCVAAVAWATPQQSLSDVFSLYSTWLNT